MNPPEHPLPLLRQRRLGSAVATVNPDLLTEAQRDTNEVPRPLRRSRAEDVHDTHLYGRHQ